MNKYTRDHQVTAHSAQTELLLYLSMSFLLQQTLTALFPCSSSILLLLYNTIMKLNSGQRVYLAYISRSQSITTGSQGRNWRHDPQNCLLAYALVHSYAHIPLVPYTLQDHLSWVSTTHSGLGTLQLTIKIMPYRYVHKANLSLAITQMRQLFPGDFGLYQVDN